MIQDKDPNTLVSIGIFLINGDSAMSQIMHMED